MCMSTSQVISPGTVRENSSSVHRRRNPVPHRIKDMPDPKMPLKQEHAQIMDKIRELYCDLFHHDGFGELKVEMKFLKKNKKRSFSGVEKITDSCWTMTFIPALLHPVRRSRVSTPQPGNQSQQRAGRIVSI